jgi:hypothetical protein
MEILIYISGLLTTFIAVLLVAAIKINRKYNLLLDSNQHISNISSIQNGEMREQIDDMRLLMVDIQNTMEKDQYESLSGINKELKVMSELAVSNNRNTFFLTYTRYMDTNAYGIIYIIRHTAARIFNIICKYYHVNRYSVSMDTDMGTPLRNTHCYYITGCKGLYALLYNHNAHRHVLGIPYMFYFNELL